MTEQEKAAAGLLYDANNDEEILARRIRCKDLCFRYNQTLPSETEKGHQIMSQILGRISGDYTILAPFWCDMGENIEIGENFYANHNCVILDGAKVTFGDNVFIAPNCCFTTASHALDVGQRNRGLGIAWPIKVGDNVWFGAGVTVLPGITIGQDSIIGAGSVVNGDIPAGVIAVGNPCRVLRKITPEDALKYRQTRTGGNV